MTDPAETALSRETAESGTGTQDAVSAEQPDPGSGQEDPGRTVSLKTWILAGLWILGALLAILLFFSGMRRLQNYGFLGAVLLLLSLAVLLSDIRTVDQFYAGNTDSAEDICGTVTVSIRCDLIRDESAPHIPEDGVLLHETSIAIREGDTVYDVLLSAAASAKLQTESAGSGPSVYVRAIGYIYEYDYGPLSGWMYQVNGESPSVGCGSYTLSPGDRIEWRYSLKLGEDL